MERFIKQIMQNEKEFLVSYQISLLITTPGKLHNMISETLILPVVGEVIDAILGPMVIE